MTNAISISSPLTAAIEVSLVTQNTRDVPFEGAAHRVDVAILALSFFDDDGRGYTDAVVVMRDRATELRSLRLLKNRIDGRHFADALQLSADMLGGAELDAPSLPQTAEMVGPWDRGHLGEAAHACAEVSRALVELGRQADAGDVDAERVENIKRACAELGGALTDFAAK